MLIRMLALSLLAPLVLLAACGGDDDDATNTPAAATDTPGGAATPAPGGGDTTTKNITVTAADFSFDTTSITAAPGQTVKITLDNAGQAEHSFTVGDKTVTEAEGGDEATGEFVVAEGDTEFHCKYHPTQMTGTITVSEEGASNPSATTGGGVSGFGY